MTGLYKEIYSNLTPLAKKILERTPETGLHTCNCNSFNHTGLKQEFSQRKKSLHNNLPGDCLNYDTIRIKFVCRQIKLHQKAFKIKV
jgi:hypothetical protein